MSAESIAPVITLSQNDIDTIAPSKRASKVSGRRRFANTCVHRQAYAEIIADNEWPDGYCPQFAHLPGNGRGPVRSSLLRSARVVAVSLIKPIFYLGLLYLAFTLLSGFVGSLPFLNGSGIPLPNSSVPNSVQQQQDRNATTDSGSNASVPPGSPIGANDPVVSK